MNYFVDCLLDLMDDALKPVDQRINKRVNMNEAIEQDDNTVAYRFITTTT